MNYINLFLTVAFFALAVFFMLRLYRLRHTVQSHMLSFLSIAALCATNLYLYRIPLEQTYITSSVAMTAWLFCMVFAIPAFGAYLDNHKTPIKLVNPPLITMCMMAVLIMTIRWFHQDSVEPLAESHIFRFSWPFFVSNLLYYICVTYVDAVTAYIYLKSIKTTTGISVFRLRSYIGFTIWFVAVITNGLVMVFNVLALPYTTEHVYVMNAICRAGRAFVAVFIIVSLVVPSAWYTPLVALLQRRSAKRLRKDLDQMVLMRNIMQAIVPSIHRPIESYILAMQPDLDPLSEARMLLIRCITEINDGRRMVWSYNERAEPFTPEEEATELASFIRDSKELFRSGPYRPAVPVYVSRKRQMSSDMQAAIKHNKAVLEHLRTIIPDLDKRTREIASEQDQVSVKEEK